MKIFFTQEIFHFLFNSIFPSFVNLSFMDDDNDERKEEAWKAVKRLKGGRKEKAIRKLHFVNEIEEKIIIIVKASLYFVKIFL